MLAMFLSQSRGSWLGLTAGLLSWRRCATSDLAGPVPVAARWPAALGRALSGGSSRLWRPGQSGRDAYRRVPQRAGNYPQHPLIGIGFGGSPTIDLARSFQSVPDHRGDDGLPALAIYLVLLGYLVTRAARALVLGQLTPWQQGQLGDLLTAITAALVAGIFDHYSSSTVFPHMVALFWLLAALLWQAATPPTADPDRSGDER